MDCSSCGALIPDDSMFCTECGARQVQSKHSHLPVLPKDRTLADKETSAEVLAQYLLKQ